MLLPIIVILFKLNVMLLLIHAKKNKIISLFLCLYEFYLVWYEFIDLFLLLLICIERVAAYKLSEYF